MSLNRIKSKVGDWLKISADAFQIQIDDPRRKNSYILDEEYLEDLYKRLSHASPNTISGEISSKCFASRHYDFNRCDTEAKSDDSELDSFSESDANDNENNIPEEVSVTENQEDEPEYIDALLYATSDDEKTDVPSPYEFVYSAKDSQSLTYVNQTNLLPSKDEIKIHICHPDTSFQPSSNELQNIGNTNLEVLTVVQSVVDTVVKQPVTIGTHPVESLPIKWDRQNLNDLSSQLPDEIVQQGQSVKLSSSLQFVHDVHPYQKTEYNTEEVEECVNKTLAPYIMCIQGIKTAADKGKSILPRLKIPQCHMSLYLQKKQTLSLMVAVVREAKVNDKRLFHACKDMKFLPASNTDRKAKAKNPIRLSLDSLPIESDGTFKVSLLLVNDPPRSTKKSSKNVFSYELSECEASNLHPTPCDPRFFRLMCILVANHSIAWDTLCLSDYIRPKQQLHV